MTSIKKEGAALIAHTSDWHIGRALNEYSLIEDQRFILKELIKILIERRVDILLISGDLYDRSMPSAEAVNLVDEILSDIIAAGIAVLVVSGNHDSRARLSFLNSLHEKSGLFIEGQLSEEVRKVVFQDKFGSINFYLLPYIDPVNARAVFPDKNIGTYDEAVGAFAESMMTNLNLNERNVLLTHGFYSYINQEGNAENEAVFSESEISMGGADIVNAARFCNFDYVALGHLHSPQKVGRDYIRYSGSLLKYSESEARTEKQVTFIELENKKNKKIYMDKLTPLRDLRVIEGSFDYMLNSDNFAGDNFEDYIYAKLTDRELVLDCALRLRTIFPNLLGIKYSVMSESTDVLVSSSDVISRKSHLDIFSDFYTAITDEDISEEKLSIIRNIIENILEPAE